MYIQQPILFVVILILSLLSTLGLGYMLGIRHVNKEADNKSKELYNEIMGNLDVIERCIERMERKANK